MRAPRRRRLHPATDEDAAAGFDQGGVCLRRSFRDDGRDPRSTRVRRVEAPGGGVAGDVELFWSGSFFLRITPHRLRPRDEQRFTCRRPGSDDLPGRRDLAALAETPVELAGRVERDHRPLIADDLRPFDSSRLDVEGLFLRDLVFSMEPRLAVVAEARIELAFGRQPSDEDLVEARLVGGSEPVSARPRGQHLAGGKRRHRFDVERERFADSVRAEGGIGRAVGLVQTHLSRGVFGVSNSRPDQPAARRGRRFRWPQRRFFLPGFLAEERTFGAVARDFQSAELVGVAEHAAVGRRRDFEERFGLVPRGERRPRDPRRAEASVHAHRRECRRHDRGRHQRQGESENQPNPLPHRHLTIRQAPSPKVAASLP